MQALSRGAGCTSSSVASASSRCGAGGTRGGALARSSSGGGVCSGARCARPCAGRLASPTRLSSRARQRRGAVVAAAAVTDSYDGLDAAFSSMSSWEDAGQPMDVRSFILERSGMVDYYSLLGVDDDATPDEIKRAYRASCKECHPDFLGDAGHNICILLNEAYEVLMDGNARAAYDAQLEAALADEADGYDGRPLSKWMPGVNPAMARNEDPAESRAVFVDENTCIGCKQCVWAAPATFRIEPDHGRSRVYAQWLNSESELQSAIDSCPVSCIHWVDKSTLPALEYVMRNRVERCNVGIMMAGQGRVDDVFAATESFLKERRRKEEAAARAKRRYSPAQEAARREAAANLMRDHLGWFAPLFKVAMSQIDMAVNGNGEELKVGRRRRAPGTRWQDRAGGPSTSAEIYFPEDSGSEDYFLVPPERALVPVAAASASPFSSLASVDRT